MSARLAEIGQLLRTQDNRITAHPIFVVQRKVRVYGIDPDLAGEHVWHHSDGSDADAEMTALLDEDYERGHRIPGEWNRTWYHEHWAWVQPFFTEEGAKEYLRVNGHNVRGETRIYVESGFRNAEWQAVREHLMGMEAPTAPAASEEASK